MSPLFAFQPDTIQGDFVKIRAGYDIAFQCPYAVPMVLMLTTHPSRDGDILSDQSMHFSSAWERVTISILTATSTPGSSPGYPTQ
jgi:hypothetical protein